MVLAELEVFQSRPIAPTRRLALGHSTLPVSPAPGYGGLLLGAVASAFVRELDPELLPELDRLSHELEHGHRIAQPRLRHRLQIDNVGLNRRVHRLRGEGEELHLEIDTTEGTSPAHQVLAALYSAGRLPPESRGPVMRVVRRGMRWRGPADQRLLQALTGRTPGGLSGATFHADPEAWALGVLGLTGPVPERKVVQGRFRELLRGAHPDHGGGDEDAAVRIAELTEARRILLAG